MVVCVGGGRVRGGGLEGGKGPQAERPAPVPKQGRPLLQPRASPQPHPGLLTLQQRDHLTQECLQTASLQNRVQVDSRVSRSGSFK